MVARGAGRRRARLLAGVLTLGLLASGATASALAPTRADYCSARDGQFASARRFVGIMDNPTVSRSVSYVNCTFGDMAADHIGIFRTPMIWAYVEHYPGVYDFRLYDHLVTLLASHRIAWLPILLQPPTFDSSAPPNAPVGPFYPPKHNSDFARFAAAAVRRYGPGGSYWKENPNIPQLPVRDWQIWNEPNLPFFWGLHSNPIAYAGLLKAGYKAIKGVDPNADVVTAGVAPSGFGIPVVRFWRTMFRHGARGAFDTLAIHPYAPGAAGSEAWISKARALLNSSGLALRRIWVTEFGWSAGGPASPFRAPSLRAQAQRTARFLAWVRRHRGTLRIRGVIYPLWRNAHYPNDYWGLHMGLLNVRAQPLPVLRVYARAAAQLNR